ncbi:trypsin-like peptidase domain-containing protein [Bacillus luteolus]|uniref:Trypsin-like peptidase domain-containing protein n=1 Tax=Litchfieldia luteola TaxID=682179 RepID=A0ABR9QMB2_9BACI|nr:trypsin-like peptidase domain-containing protein [Cytobacillus luteolus]MBE4909650.1 trypsin-like peptidase domain-containing protein [Cytobacillus luteolus]MBP1941051.1 S1-C subfamily serine protease [Cytobacillus luteolus]
MKGKWIVSIVTSVIIWGAGIFAFLTIQDSIPQKLTASSQLIVNEGSKKKEDSGKRELKEIIYDSQKLVVKVELDDGSIGSGFLYNNKGDVITNAHVAANATNVRITTADSKGYEGTVIGISGETDIALIRVPGLAGIEPLPIAKERKAEIGDEVLALGTPLGFQNTVTTGIISGVNRDLDIEPFHYEDVYQISAPIARGNSGGPLIDRKTGEVIGINSAGIIEGVIGFSIPISSIIAMIEEWSESPMVELPSIDLGIEGMAIEEISDEDIAGYVVTYFYESINYGDYLTAYAALGSNWQTETSYEDFRTGYINTLAVQIDELTATQTGKNMTVTVLITADERVNGEIVQQSYRVDYEVGYENDQLKILSGQGEKLADDEQED